MYSSGSAAESGSVTRGRITGSTTAASAQRGGFEARTGQTSWWSTMWRFAKASCASPLQNPNGRAVWRRRSIVVVKSCSTSPRTKPGVVLVQGEDSTVTFTVFWEGRMSAAQPSRRRRRRPPPTESVRHASRSLRRRSLQYAREPPLRTLRLASMHASVILTNTKNGGSRDKHFA